MLVVLIKLKILISAGQLVGAFRGALKVVLLTYWLAYSMVIYT